MGIIKTKGVLREYGRKDPCLLLLGMQISTVITYNSCKVLSKLTAELTEASLCPLLVIHLTHLHQCIDTQDVCQDLFAPTL